MATSTELAKIQRLELELAQARARIRELEAALFDATNKVVAK